MGARCLASSCAKARMADRVKAIALDSPAISFSAVTGQLAGMSGYPLAECDGWIASQLAPEDRPGP